MTPTTYPELRALRSSRCYLTAPASDPRWGGVKGLQTRVFQPNSAVSQAVKVARQGTLLYLPKYPRDFEKHPDVFQVLECLVYVPGAPLRQTVKVQALTVGTFVFLLQPSLRESLFDGSKTEMDILGMLEKRAL